MQKDERIDPSACTLILVDGPRSAFADTFAEHLDIGGEGFGTLPTTTLRIFSSAPPQLALHYAISAARRDYPFDGFSVRYRPKIAASGGTAAGARC